MGIVEVMDRNFPRKQAFKIQPTGEDPGFNRLGGICPSFSHLETAMRRFSSGRRMEGKYYLTGNQHIGYQLAVPIGITADGHKQYLYLARLKLADNAPDFSPAIFVI